MDNLYFFILNHPVFIYLINYLSIYLGLVVSRIVKGNIPVQNGIVHLIGISVHKTKL